MLHPKADVDHDHLKMVARTRKPNIAPGLERNLAQRGLLLAGPEIHLNHDRGQDPMLLLLLHLIPDCEIPQNQGETLFSSSLLMNSAHQLVLIVSRNADDEADFVLLMMLWPKFSRSYLLSRFFSFFNYFAFDCWRLISEFVNSFRVIYLVVHCRQIKRVGFISLLTFYYRSRADN